MLVIRLWLLGLVVLLAVFGVSSYNQWVSVRRNTLVLLQAYAGEYAMSFRSMLMVHANMLEQTDHALQETVSAQHVLILQELLRQEGNMRDVALLDRQGLPILSVGLPWLYPSQNAQLTKATRDAWRACPSTVQNCLTPPVPAPRQPGLYLAANLHRLRQPIGSAVWIVMVHTQNYPRILRDIRQPFQNAGLVVLRDHDHLLQVRNPSPTQVGYGYPQSGALVQSLQQHPNSTEGSYAGVPTSTGRRVVGAYVRVPGWPFVVAVVLPHGDLWGLWLRDMVPLTAMLVSVGVLGYWLLRAGLHELHAAERDRLKAHAALQSQMQISERLATHDHLTGLLNRRGMDLALQKAFTLATRTGHSFGVILMDLDHFKQINDNYGHPAGDAVLVQVAALLQQVLRKSDAVSRWGGEEFLMLLPDVDLPGAFETAERIRVAITQAHLQHGERVPALTASFGVAAWSVDNCTSDSLLSQLDALLYEAKRNGRNQVRGIARPHWGHAAV